MKIAIAIAKTEVRQRGDAYLIEAVATATNANTTNNSRSDTRNNAGHDEPARSLATDMTGGYASRAGK
jgi:hypothetical protein